MLDNSCESYPSSFQGGVSDEATLTAFVTVSLLESGMSPEVLLTSCAIRSLRLVIEFCVQPLRKCWVDVRWKVLHPLFKSSIMLVNSQRVPHSHFVWNFCFFAHGKPLTSEGNEEVMNFYYCFLRLLVLGFGGTRMVYYGDNTPRSFMLQKPRVNLRMRRLYQIPLARGWG